MTLASAERRLATADEDCALMRRIGGGDAAALRKLSERFTPMLYGIAWRMLGDSSEAEDVVQDVMVRVWICASDWAPSGGGLGAWLRRTGTNLCLDRLRKLRRISSGPVPDRADEAMPADVGLDEERRRSAIRDAMLRLPDRQRAAIILSYHEGLANAESAAILGIGIKAFESLLVRARQGLTHDLARRGYFDGGMR